MPTPAHAPATPTPEQMASTLAKLTDEQAATLRLIAAGEFAHDRSRWRENGRIARALARKGLIERSTKGWLVKPWLLTDAGLVAVGGAS